MSLLRIILTIFIITYGTNASFWYDKLSNKFTVSADMDDVEENDIGEDYDADSDSDNLFGADNLYPDYSDENYEHQVNVLERQLPESGEAKIKKSQTWCKIQKVSRAHFENGYEFFPKSYTEYDCVPHIKHDSTLDNAIYSHDICPVHHGHCLPMQKKYYFMKRKLNEKCWKLEERAVKVGCKCIPPTPF